MKRPQTPTTTVQSLPLRPMLSSRSGAEGPASPATATPYPAKATAPPDPYAANRTPAASGTMLRGLTRNGVVHPLGGAALPDGLYVKIIVE